MENEENCNRLTDLFNYVGVFVEDRLGAVDMDEKRLLDEAVEKQSELLSEIMSLLPSDKNDLITEYQKATSFINASRESRIYLTGLADGMDVKTSLNSPQEE